MPIDRRLPAVFLLACAGTAQAALLEGEPYVAARIEHDSNVLRYSDAAEAQALRGDPQRADTYQTYTAGAALRYTLSLQRFYLGAEARRTRYQDFEDLDHNGGEWGAGWDWRIGTPWSGRLRYKFTRDQESFNGRDLADPGDLRTRDLEATAGVDITPRWRVETSLRSLRSRYSAALSQDLDLDEDRSGLALVYKRGFFSRAALAVEHSRGRYPEREASSGLIDRFDQTELRTELGYTPSGLSNFEARLGHTERDNGGLAARDFSDATGLLAYTRTFSGKSFARAELFRRLYNVEEFDANFVRQDGLALSLDWQLSSFLTLIAKGEWIGEDYLGTPVLVTGARRHDQVDSASLKLRWKPFFWLSLSPELRHEARDSNRADRRYTSNIAAFTVELRYD